jgi:proline iminopeptidase
MLIAGHELWVRRIPGRGAMPPLVIVSGGPGLSARYLEPLEALGDGGREIILYDPLGCGRSEHPVDPPLYTVELFTDELSELISILSLERIHVLGHSAGAAIAFNYALREPQKTVSLIAYSPIFDFDDWITEQRRLLSAFSTDVVGRSETLFESYYREHACRLSTWPECLTKSFSDLNEDPRVFATMYGTDVFTLSGTLLGFTLLHRLHEIVCPVLLLSGLFDSATPRLMGRIRARIRDVEQHTLTLSSHTAHLEEPQAFLTIVRNFLAARDRTAGAL